jgi:hypothetical protein
MEGTLAPTYRMKVPFTPAVPREDSPHRPDRPG